MMNNFSRNLQTLIVVGLIMGLASCVPVRKLKYTQGDKENEQINDYFNERQMKTIQPYDNLYIKVYSLDEKTSAIFDGGGNTYRAENLNLVSYNVNNDGEIEFPFVGKIYVKDLTIYEAKSKIENLLKQYLSNISVVVKYVGNKVTILGEVNRPGEYPYYNDKLTVFQALGFAGGIADYGNKKTVTLIREIDNIVSYHKLDLTDKEIVKSDYYFLLPNDVILVEPVRAKYRRLFDYSLISTTLSVITTLIVVLNYTSNN
jgi:polysaccharide export outer membrane protein